MNLSALDSLAVFAYFGLMAWLGYITRRTKTFSEFAVGGHSIPTIIIFASLAATIVGPGFSIGVTSRSWGMGFAFYYLAVAFAAQTLSTGLFFGPKLTEQRDCNTLGDVMRKRYGLFTQMLTGIVSVGVCIGFTAVMGKIGGSTLHGITGWPLELCLVIVTGTTALLTFTGGLRATVATEGVQFSMKAIIVPVMLLLAVAASHTSLTDLAAKAANLTRLSFASMSGWQITGIASSFALGEVLIPPYANRALAAKTVAASRTGFLLAGGFIIVWLAIVAALGIVGHSVVPATTNPDDVFVAIGRAVLPVGIFGILLAAVVAIVMSSQESVLNSGAVALVRDIIAVVSPIDEKTALVFARAGTIAIAIVAILSAQFAPSIIDGLLLVYAIWAPTMIVSLLAALYLKTTKPLASWLSMLGGAGASLGWQFAEPKSELPAILVGMAASMALYALGHAVGTPYRAAATQRPE
jgi:SSS family solute:Na+ symporter